MIKNDKQYQVTKSRLKDFTEALGMLEQQELDPLLKELHQGAIKSQINDFTKEIIEYELLKEGKVTHVFVKTIPDFYEALIKARLAKRWTQADLAKHLKLKEQQIQRYEMDNYSTASLSKISEVAAVLEIEIKLIKMKISQPVFSSELDIETVSNGYKKMKENRTLLPV